MANAKWTEVAKNKEGNIFYVDFEKILKHDGLVFYWRLMDYLEPTPEPDLHLSVSYRFEAECLRFRQRFLQVNFYRQIKGEGPAENFSHIQIDWTEVPFGSAAEAVLQAVCNHKP